MMTKLHKYINIGRGKKTAAYPHTDKTGSNKAAMSGFGQHTSFDSWLAGNKGPTGGNKYGFDMKGTYIDTERKQP